jgi:hypothetical protein
MLETNNDIPLPTIMITNSIRTSKTSQGTQVFQHPAAHLSRYLHKLSAKGFNPLLDTLIANTPRQPFRLISTPKTSKHAQPVPRGFPPNTHTQNKLIQRIQQGGEQDIATVNNL